MAGITGIGRNQQSNAMQGMLRVSSLEEQRDQANQAIKSQEKQAQISSTATGAATGAMIGASYGGYAGPVGAVVGAGLGYLLNEVF